MARRRNIIAQFVNFDMAELAARIQGMTDAQIGAWWRKAVIDCCSGCIDPKTDPIIRARYDRAIARMIERQDQNSRAYQNRKNRLNDQETNNGTATTSCASTISTDDRAGNPLTRESETSGPQTDNNLAESATRTSEAIKALADGDIREDSLNMPDGSNAARTESVTSAKTLGEARQNLQESASGSTVRGLAKVAQPGADSPADLFPEDTAKKPYGTCKHVMLTDADGHHLREVYGQDLALAIEILDAYLENNPKALKKYKNHAAVLRKGNWVWQKVQENKLTAKRLENANVPKSYKSFKQQDLDARTEFFSKSIFDKGIA
ncbi:hypothetical protein [Fibrobacter sp.]|uniref:hypothetical protein n=1 Tax=Fibrobacter sp. TaxID=35828 RepID=UPI0025C41247|nr:hypothetical protein [Fibrobacter sp.]MCI6437357.1 hypothetical protein [Fibrobacter sp.]